MALLHVNFFSDVLGHAVSADVILPEQRRTLIGMETSAADTFRTLYLLHGLSDDETIWQRRTSVERYVAGRNMAVVMPDGGRGWYADAVHGSAYMTFVSEELPHVMRSFFRGMTDRREDNFIAGLSMGGHGALKIGLLYPERFRGIGCLSGALDLYRRSQHLCGAEVSEWSAIFGDYETIPGSVNDIRALSGRAAAAGTALPSVYMWCGTEDGLLQDSRDAKAYLTEAGFDLSYHESPGSHSWECWDAQIQNVLNYFDTLK